MLVSFENIIINESIFAYNTAHEFYNASLKNFFSKDEALTFNNCN